MRTKEIRQAEVESPYTVKVWRPGVGARPTV